MDLDEDEGGAANSGKCHNGKKPTVYIPVLEDKREGDVCCEQHEVLNQEMGEPRSARNRLKNAESLKWKFKDSVESREGRVLPGQTGEGEFS